MTESEAKSGSRKGRPNYDREFRRRLAAAACEPGASVAKLARDNGINANMLFTWRRRYREQLQAETTSLIPVAVVHETPPQRVTMPSDAGAVGNRTTRAGTIEIRFGDLVVKVDGIVDADTLRVVLGSVRS
ncbi:IS66-like element accessory protein TnpA [Paraburkholderia tuberum]|uniref:IS66-like element accessory protein TnpA n=1 Tax=Paraburkholderia tuberum TaxID=157910 RepID=UPI001FC98F7B|nr:transposase [Paraburkholderia tuberum]